MSKEVSKKVAREKRIGKMKLIRVYKFGRKGKVEIKDFEEEYRNLGTGE